MKFITTNLLQLVKASFVVVILLLVACKGGETIDKVEATKKVEPTEKSTTEEKPPNQQPFKVDFAMSLYASSLNKDLKAAANPKQILDKAVVRQAARDYLNAWDTHDMETIKEKLTRVFSPEGTYSDPGETAYGLENLSHVISGMHKNLKGLIRVFHILGEPELIENTNGLFHNVENILVYNWSWRQDGKHVLPGKNMTMFTDDQQVKYDMGIFSTESFPHFKHLPEATRNKMEGFADNYLAQLNGLGNDEKYQLLETVLTHPASTMNGNHTDLLAQLKSKQLDKAVFKRTGKPSFTRISIAYPWTLSIGDEILLAGREVNVFDKDDSVKYAFGFSGN